MIITFTKYDHKWDDIKTFNVSFIFVIILSYQYQWSQIWIFILNVLLTPREVDPPRHAGGQLENSLGGAGAQRAAKSLGEQNGNIWENGGLIWLNMMKKKKSDPQWECRRVKPTMEWIVGYNEFCWRAFLDFGMSLFYSTGKFYIPSSLKFLCQVSIVSLSKTRAELQSPTCC